ncbi:MAG: radical SAM protein [Candidatus Gastranaerophilales bacterium]|nr:radical SAM protein [Candidatus Gastranaerophilales bacterium]
MNRKVLLIYPPGQLMNREDRCQVPSKDVVIAPPLPPGDLMYMAAVAEETGYTCKIIDYTLNNSSVDNFVKDLKEFQPDYLVISITTPTIKNDLKVCSITKKTIPDIQIIAKGAHFLKFNTQILEEFTDLDMAIRGETEITFKEILSGKLKSEIMGLTWQSPDGPHNNPNRPFNEDLDSLPYPARHLVNNTIYVRPDNGKIQGIIKVSRGCPFNCFFCLASPVSGRKVRVRSVNNVLGEIKQCMELYGMKDFLLWSDIFNLDKNWVIELCNIILESKLKFNWATNTRVDTMDIDTAKLMKKAGCTLVSVGVESGNQEILEKMGKKTDLNKIKEAFKIFKKADLKTFAYYIIGLPWDTRETVEDTIRLAIELDSDFANFFTATAFPGTRFYDYAIENNLFESDIDNYELFMNTYHYPTVKGHYLSKEEIVKLHNKAVKRFFLRPNYIIKCLFRIRSLKEIQNYIKAGLSVLRH